MLENGNYEVTPAFLIWVGDLKKELKECQELLERK